MEIDRDLVNISLFMISPGDVVSIPEEGPENIFLVTKKQRKDPLEAIMVEVVNIETGIIYKFKETTRVHPVCGKFVIYTK